MSQRSAALKFSTRAEYRRLIEGGNAAAQEEIQALTIALTTGETHFFRDTGQFSLLEKTILPRLIAEKQDSRLLRVWSAGCATGEEAYSLAILVRSILSRPGDWRIEILGTDINPRSLDKAREGVYTDWSFRVIGAERKQKYFQQRGAEWSLCSEIRDMVRFLKLDLVHDEFPGPLNALHGFDLILCRNVFIYFDAKTIGYVLDKLARALRPGGYLLTAHGELHGQDLRSLETLGFSGSTAYRRRSDMRPGGPAQPEEPVAPPEPGRAEESARCCANQGRYEEAEEFCRQALETNPLAASVYYLRARIAAETGDSNRRKEMLNKVLYLDPGHVAACVDMADLCEAEGNAGRSAKLRALAMDSLLRLHPDSPVEGFPITAGELQPSLQKLIDEAHR